MLTNGSDNALIDFFLDPTFGCTPFMAPDLGNNNQMTSSQALDELLAAKNQTAVTALVPENDEMVLDGNGNFDAAKTNLYRAEVGQAPVSNQNNRQDSPAMYCQNMVNIQTPFLAANQTLLATGASPVPAVGNNLFTFLANRLSMSFTNLNCQTFGLTNPVTATLDGNGVAIAATFNTTQQTVTNTTGTPPATGGRRPRGRRRPLGRRRRPRAVTTAAVVTTSGWTPPGCSRSAGLLPLAGRRSRPSRDRLLSTHSNRPASCTLPADLTCCTLRASSLSWRGPVIEDDHHRHHGEPEGLAPPAFLDDPVIGSSGSEG